jgi:hypothetical protein
MLNSRTFKKIYRQLQEEEGYASAIYAIRENMPNSLELFHYELKTESDIEVKNTLAGTYNDLIQKQFPSILQMLLRKDFLSLEQIFGHLTAFIFDKVPFDVNQQLDTYTNQLIKRLNKKILENGNPEAIIEEIHYKITQSLLIDNAFLGHYDFTEVAHQHIISQYSLGILVLIIAEKLELPIYGLPFSDKLVLCYTQDYCTHSELVTENDILYYIVIGEKDIIYTLEDLKLLALIQEETLELHKTLPKSTHKIIEGWLQHLSQGDFDAKTKYNLSSIYQQIFSLTEEF